jgi:hypothetical protein
MIENVSWCDLDLFPGSEWALYRAQNNEGYVFEYSSKPTKSNTDIKGWEVKSGDKSRLLGFFQVSPSLQGKLVSVMELKILKGDSFLTDRDVEIIEFLKKENERLVLLLEEKEEIISSLSSQHEQK